MPQLFYHIQIPLNSMRKSRLKGIFATKVLNQDVMHKDNELQRLISQIVLVIDNLCYNRK